MKLYIAGSSRELDRAEAMIAYATSRGHTVTFDWTIDLKKHMEAGLSDAHLDAVEARRYASMDLDAIDAADGLLFLSPVTQTKGAWVELGYAYGRGKVVVVSYTPYEHWRDGLTPDAGLRPRASIFEEIGIRVEEADALRVLEEKVG